MQKQILFVCTGNTCRSPMAQVLLRDMLSAKEDFVVCSAGLFAKEGSPMSEMAQQVLRDEYGLDGSQHRAQQLTEEMALQSDWILAMTEGHKSYIQQVFPLVRVETLKAFATGQSGDISDPFLGSFEDYRRCAQEIRACLAQGISFLSGESV